MAIEYSKLRHLRRSKDVNSLLRAKTEMERLLEPAVRPGNVYGNSRVPAAHRIWYGLAPFTRASFAGEKLVFESGAGSDSNAIEFPVGRLPDQDIKQILISGFGEQAYEDMALSAAALVTPGPSRT